MLFDKMFHQEPDQVKQSLLGRLNNSEEVIEQADRDRDTLFVNKISPVYLRDFKNAQAPETYLNEDVKTSTQRLELPVYVKVFEKVVTHIETTRRPEIGSMVFDKDDVDALEFVVAAANVRAFNFGIELESAFKIKELAGKIIPAISSSNALVASMQVHEAIKLLLNHTDKLKLVTYARLDRQKRLTSTARKHNQREPKCPVCADDSLYVAVVTLPLATTTLRELIDDILPSQLQIETSTIQVYLGSQQIFERDEDMSEDEKRIFDKKLERPLANNRIHHQSIVGVTASLDGSEINLEIQLIEGHPVSARLLKRGVPKV